MLSAKAILAALSALTLARALDVEVTDYECDQSLPITADFGITCGGRSKCTFGSSIATVEGTRKLERTMSPLSITELTPCFDSVLQ